MGYVTGDTILDDEYIAFVSATGATPGINTIIGTGDGTLGLGQTELGVINAGDTITAAQWNSLFTAMDNLANHTNRSITSTAARASGDTITAISALSTDLANLQADVQGGCVNATALTAGSEDSSRVASAVFDTSHIVEEKFTFVGGDEARFFFNAGGKLRISITNNKTNDTGKDASVDALIAALGNLDIGAHASTRSGSGETLTTNGLGIGYYDLTTSYQTIILLTEDSGDYSGDIQVKVEAKTDAAHADGRNNNGVNVTVKTSILLNETTRTDYTSGNLDSIAVEEEAAGTTDVSHRTVDPTTAQGLGTVYTNVSLANVSNAVVNND